MTAIKPISDLRNYNEVLKECVNGNPVYLTKNGRGKYIILEIETYDEQIAKMKLLEALAEGEADAAENGLLYPDGHRFPESRTYKIKPRHPK